MGNVKDLGTESINGQTCRVIQYTPTTTVAGTPTTTTADGKTTTIEYTNIKVGALPSDTFTVPASLKITSAP